jgi:hypothetical protein
LGRGSRTVGGRDANDDDEDCDIYRYKPGPGPGTKLANRSHLQTRTTHGRDAEDRKDKLTTTQSSRIFSHLRTL